MKLIKTVDEQGVMYSLSGDSLPENYVLSLKNCQAIERGYDLDELAENKWLTTGIYPDPTPTMKKVHFKTGFIYGFQKALEILGDKKFSEDDVINAHSVGRNYQRNAEMDCQITPYLKSLQQTEWEVTYNPNEKDADDCLILKRL